MAKWSFSKKHLPSEINGGNQYEIKDRLVLEQLNAITENSFYASEKVDTVISDAQGIVNQGKTEIENTTSQGKNELNSIVDDAEDLVAKANASINTVVGTANEALFTVQQVVASKGYYGSNPNLLINGDFRVNQRGQKLYERTSGRVYTVDRWNIWSNNCSFNAETKTLTNLATSGNAIFSQFIENTPQLLNKTLTISAKINGQLYKATGTIPNSFEDKTSDYAIAIYEHKINNVVMFYVRIAWDASRKFMRADVGCSTTQGSITIDYIKAEVGSVATAFSPRPYAEELTMCERYYQKIKGLKRAISAWNFYDSYNNMRVPMRVTPTIIDIYAVDDTQTVSQNPSTMFDVTTHTEIQVEAYHAYRSNLGVKTQFGNEGGLTINNEYQYLLVCDAEIG